MLDYLWSLIELPRLGLHVAEEDWKIFQNWELARIWNKMFAAYLKSLGTMEYLVCPSWFI
jgi:hypothetical protein